MNDRLRHPATTHTAHPALISNTAWLRDGAVFGLGALGGVHGLGLALLAWSGVVSLDAWGPLLASSAVGILGGSLTFTVSACLAGGVFRVLYGRVGAEVAVVVAAVTTVLPLSLLVGWFEGLSRMLVTFGVGAFLVLPVIPWLVVGRLEQRAVWRTGVGGAIWLLVISGLSMLL